MLATRGLPPFPQVDQLDVYENDVPWSWDLVASFTGFLVEQHGMEKYLALWNSAKGLTKDCPAIFGSSFDDLYRRWIDFLRARPLPPGTRWRPLEEELLAPGLYAGALAELDRFPSDDRWVLLLRARACAGLGATRRRWRPSDGSARVPSPERDSHRRPDAGPAPGRPPPRHRRRAGGGPGLLPGGGGAGDLPRSRPGRGRRRTEDPHHTGGFSPPAGPGCGAAGAAQGPLRRADRAVDAGPAGRRAGKPPADKLVLLFRDLDTPLKRRADWLKEATWSPRSLERPEKFTAAWDAFSAGPIDLAPAREILRQDLEGFVPERCLAKIREAGIPIVDLAGCLQARK